MSVSNLEGICSPELHITCGKICFTRGAAAVMEATLGLCEVICTWAKIYGRVSASLQCLQDTQCWPHLMNHSK